MGGDLWILGWLDAGPHLDWSLTMTQRDLFTGVRKLGLKIRKTSYGDYRVTIPNESREQEEALAYYTDDMLDAYQTACALAQNEMDIASQE